MPSAPKNFFSADKSLFPKTIFEYQIGTFDIKGVDGFLCVNGTYINSYSLKNAVGPTLIDNVWNTGADTQKGYSGNRGAVAVVNGSVKVRRFVNDSANDKVTPTKATSSSGVVKTVQKYDLGIPGDARKIFGGAVSQLMGGGIMLISDGADVMKLNTGDQDDGTLRNAYRVCVGNNSKGDAFLVLCFGADLAMVVSLLVARGYTHLCSFDGSQAFWVRKRDGVTRMCIDGSRLVLPTRSLDPVSYCLKMSGTDGKWLMEAPTLQSANPGNNLGFWGRDGKTEKCFVWANG
jgi:hypothetical protein